LESKKKKLKEKKEMVIEDDDDEDVSDEEIEVCNCIICPQCQSHFSTEEELGTHFLEVHNNYGAITDLDISKGIGFPGFEILEKIEMVQPIKSEDFPKYFDEDCNICYEKFHEESGKYSKIPTFLDGYRY
jgi:hypothetical protein